MPGNIVDQIGLPPSGGPVYASPVPVVSGYSNRGYYPNNGAYVTPDSTPRNVIQITPQQQQGIPMMPVLGNSALGTIPESMQFSAGIAGGGGGGRGGGGARGGTLGGTQSFEDRANQVWNQRYGYDRVNRSDLMPQRRRMAREEAFGRLREQIPQPIPQPPQTVQESGNGNLNIINLIGAGERALDSVLNEINSISSSGQVVEETVEEALVREQVARATASYNPEVVMRQQVREQTGLGAGSIADAFDEPQIHTSEQAAAEADQEKILDEEERTELDKYNHPLSDEWVKKLPPYDPDLKPAERCVMDCKERTRIHGLECDEVRRRVTRRLNDLGCLTRWVAIPQKSPCS